jgi:hypothetical protein
MEYLRRMIAAGAPFDMLSIHPYSASPPAEEPALETVNFRRSELYRDLLISGRQHHLLLGSGRGGRRHAGFGRGARRAPREAHG